MDNTSVGKQQYIPRASQAEKAARTSRLSVFKQSPLPEAELLDNLLLFERPQHIARLLALAEVYSHILDIHGIVCEFGVRWGRNLTLFTALRAVYEPFNFYRKIVGFDTFAGYPTVSPQDGTAEIVRPGAFDVVPGYESFLESLLAIQESESPLSHIRRFELRKGDAPDEVKSYLVEHPETMIALAYFDLDLYQPTRACLEAILPFLSRGSVLAFDELIHPEFPGETVAFREILGDRRYCLRRTRLHPSPSFVVIE
jgi:hypothetical protein